MNCYAYALQVYCRDNLTSSSSYYLKPGEFGIRFNQDGISNYAQLKEKYADFNYKGKYKEYMDFVEKRMIEDSNALEFNLKKLNITNNFTLSDNFNSNSERIISMVVGISKGIADYHFYVRNGNGTCQNGHGNNCSMWSHKLSNGEISNKKINSNNILCDSNIVKYANSGIYSNYNNDSPVRFYSITKDVNVYNSWHNNGTKPNSTGTQYRP